MKARHPNAGCPHHVGVGARDQQPAMFARFGRERRQQARQDDFATPWRSQLG
jgi:hypothetical protein